MIYFTRNKQKNEVHQITFEEMLFGIKPEMLIPYDNAKGTNDTETRLVTSVYINKLTQIFPIMEKIEILEKFLIKYKHLLDVEDKQTLYLSFKIPKRSGGYRQINAPKEELMLALRELKFIFEKHLYAQHHTTAFAYVKGRCTIDAIKRHQENKSRWFLKLDFHDFFGSTTFDFLKQQLKLIYPYSEIYKIPRGESALDSVLSLCFLNGGLPQGTPISPTLTNLMMIPIDHQISKLMREEKPHICYTRYADDLLLSSEFSFKWSEIQNKIINVLNEFNATFQLNTKKTRYGSNSGRNWNLGVMLNKDNEITIGHQKKRIFKAMIFQFMTDFTKGDYWDIGTVQELQGQLSYYRMIEKQNIDNILDSYSRKFNIKVDNAIKQILSNKII